jgi:hypothetical protein
MRNRLFPTSTALIASRLSPDGRRLGEEGDSFVAVPFLATTEVDSLRAYAPKGVGGGTLLPALNFDPPEDHSDGAEFTYSDVLLNDFSAIHGDIGTLRGVAEGHFPTLLGWQPRIDPKTTVLVAIVAPGESLKRTEVKETAALPALAEALARAGYDAVAIRCKGGDDAEFADCITFAEQMTKATSLPILHVARTPRHIHGTPFSMTIRDESQG